MEPDSDLGFETRFGSGSEIGSGSLSLASLFGVEDGFLLRRGTKREVRPAMPPPAAGVTASNVVRL